MILSPSFELCRDERIQYILKPVRQKSYADPLLADSILQDEFLTLRGFRLGLVPHRIDRLERMRDRLCTDRSSRY